MDPQLDEPDLRSYLGVISRRKWWVAGITAIFFGIAVAMSVLPNPRYEVKAKVLTYAGTDLAAMVTGSGQSLDLNREAENQVARIDGAGLRARVGNALPASVSRDQVWNVNVRALPSSDSNRTSSIVQLSVVTTDPEAGVQLLRIYAETYVTYWDQLSQEAFQTGMGILATRREALTTQVAAVQQQLEDPNLSTLDHDILFDQAVDLSRQARGLQNRIDDLALGTELGGRGAEVVSPALLPSNPVSPDVPKNLAIGLVFGVFLGIAVAFLRDYFDDSVKSKDVVERVTGVPALGLIPRFATSESELVAAAAPSSPAAEAFRSLRTSVKFLSVDREVRVVQVTSPSPGEGKTVTATNLAVVFAQAGDRVVLVGGDLRRPRAEEILGVPLTPGLTGVLIGEVALPQAIRAVEGLPNLSVLPAGYPPPNPSELLSGERARRLIDVLAQTYDLVVIDCPPVLPVTDALVLARMADTTLLVTSANRTSRRALDRSVEVLQQVGAPLMGTVMTSLAPGATFGGEPYRYEAVSSHYSKGSPYPAFSGSGNGYGGGASGQYSADPQPGSGQMPTGQATAAPPRPHEPDYDYPPSEPPQN